MKIYVTFSLTKTFKISEVSLNVEPANNLPSPPPIIYNVLDVLTVYVHIYILRNIVIKYLYNVTFCL